MKYIAAYALLVLGGNAAPKAADIEKVLKEAGIKSEADQIETLLKSVAGKSFHELVKAGSSKLASMAPAGGAPVAAAATGKPVAAKVEEKPKEEEAADVDMGGLFGDDY